MIPPPPAPTAQAPSQAPDIGLGVEVTDPDMLSKLQPQEVTDPNILGKLNYNIDFTGKPSDIRGQIAKLPKPQQQPALDNWADSVVQKQRQDNPWPMFLEDMMRASTRQVGLPGPWLNRIEAGTNYLTGGGSYDEALAYQNARDRAFDQSNPGTSAALQMGGGLAGLLASAGVGGTGLLSRAARLAVGGPFADAAVPETMAGRMFQGAKIGSVIGGNVGLASTPDLTDPYNAMEHTTRGMIAGGMGGAAMTPLIEGGVGALSKVGGTVRNMADVQRAADQVVLEDMANANMTPADALAKYEAHQDAAQLWYNGKAALPESLAEVIGPTAQRTLQGATISSPEAYNMAANMLEQRQEGRGLFELPLPSKMSVAEKEATFGQQERLGTDLARALQVKSSPTAYQSDQKLSDILEQDASPKYTAAENAAQPFATQLGQTLDYWNAKAAKLPAVSPTRKLIDKMTAQFYMDEGRTRPLGAQDMTSNANTTPDLWAFNEAKKNLDDDYSEAVRVGRTTDAGTIQDFTHDVLDAVHGGAPNSNMRNAGLVPNAPAAPALNPLYQAARTAWAGPKRTMDAIQFGRDAFKEDAEALPDQIAALEPDQLKAARMGLLETAKRRLNKAATNEDVSRLFRQRSSAGVINAFLPKPGEMFGKYTEPGPQLQTITDVERAMGITKQKILGGSPTAERLTDVERLKGLGHYFSMFLKPGISWENVAATAAKDLYEKMKFGDRLGRAIAHRYTQIEPESVRAVIAQVQQRHGAMAAAQFRQSLYQRAMRAVTGPAVAVSTEQQQPEQQSNPPTQLLQRWRPTNVGGNNGLG
jgi:hypothetical protein